MTITIDPKTGVVALDGIPWPRLVATERDKVRAQLDEIEQSPNPPANAPHWDDVVSVAHELVAYMRQSLAAKDWREIEEDARTFIIDLAAWTEFIKQVTED